MLILDVWREACRHPDIGEAVERIAAMLPPELPPATLLVRRLDAGRGRLETVAAAGPAWSEVAPVARTEVPAERMVELLSWCRNGRLARHRADAVPPPVDAAVPDGLTGDVLVGPLLDDAGEPIGVALLVARLFGAVHENTAERLLEPLSVALQNDARLRDLTRERTALRADRASLLERLGRGDLSAALVGCEAGLRTVMDRVRQVAPAEVPVLVLGEAGTGKEAVAREIHRLSGRSGGPLVRICCARPDPLGDVTSRTSYLEQADGGTLYLDDVGDLPLDEQGRLLRLLQQGVAERADGRALPVDARVVAATRGDPLEMVQSGRFREDLWYRVGVFPIRIPPLRERTEDLGALATHFAAAAGVRVAGHPIEPTAADLAMLAAYDWPGNLRELATVIERAALLGEGGRLEVAAALGAPRAGAAPVTKAVLPLDDAMVEHIEEALRASRGRIEGGHGAAALLGINPHTLRSRMRKLGIDWNRFRGLARAG